MDIKAIRKNLKLSQEEFGKIVGVSRQTIVNWEKGEELPEQKQQYLRTVLEKLKYSDTGRFSVLGFVNEPTGEYNTENPDFQRHKRYIEFLEQELRKQDERISILKDQIKDLISQNEMLLNDLGDKE